MNNIIKYHDNSEEYLNEFFNEKTEADLNKTISKIINSNPPWPIFYHLSPQRKMILEWYPFKKESSLLEIGAGCGALTGLFCEKCKKVTALELEADRAEVIKKRYKDKTNLTVLQQNFNNFDNSIKYDYVTLIGVWEYSGRFFGQSQKKYNNKLFIEVLKKCRSLLNENGKLIIAIENKLGIKYLSGCLEDHYGKGFESIEDYPDYNGIRTFSKFEIKKILHQSGFIKQPQIFYPFPDYKLPSQIFSKSFLEHGNIPITSYLPTPDPSQPREYLMNEILFGKSLHNAKLFTDFANSFLFIVKK